MKVAPECLEFRALINYAGKGLSDQKVDMRETLYNFYSRSWCD